MPTKEPGRFKRQVRKRGHYQHLDDPLEFGKRLRQLRQARGLTQRGLAFPGCSNPSICRMERGDRAPSLQVLRELARKLGTTESYLAWGQPETDPDAAAKARTAKQQYVLELFGDASADELRALKKALDTLRRMQQMR